MATLSDFSMPQVMRRALLALCPIALPEERIDFDPYDVVVMIDIPPSPLATARQLASELRHRPRTNVSL